MPIAGSEPSEASGWEGDSCEGDSAALSEPAGSVVVSVPVTASVSSAVGTALSGEASAVLSTVVALASSGAASVGLWPSSEDSSDAFSLGVADSAELSAADDSVSGAPGTASDGLSEAAAESEETGSAGIGMGVIVTSSVMTVSQKLGDSIAVTSSEVLEVSAVRGIVDSVSHDASEASVVGVSGGVGEPDSAGDELDSSVGADAETSVDSAAVELGLSDWSAHTFLRNLAPSWGLGHDAMHCFPLVWKLAGAEHQQSAHAYVSETVKGGQSARFRARARQRRTQAPIGAAVGSETAVVAGRDPSCGRAETAAVPTSRR